MHALQTYRRGRMPTGILSDTLWLGRSVCCRRTRRLISCRKGSSGGESARCLKVSSQPGMMWPGAWCSRWRMAMDSHSTLHFVPSCWAFWCCFTATLIVNESFHLWPKRKLPSAPVCLPRLWAAYWYIKCPSMQKEQRVFSRNILVPFWLQLKVPHIKTFKTNKHSQVTLMRQNWNIMCYFESNLEMLIVLQYYYYIPEIKFIWKV